MLPLAIDKDFLEEHDRLEADQFKESGPQETSLRDANEE